MMWQVSLLVIVCLSTGQAIDLLSICNSDEVHSLGDSTRSNEYSKYSSYCDDIEHESASVDWAGPGWYM